MAISNDCLILATRPRWDQDGGIWYVEQGVVVGRSKMYRHKPRIHAICEPLLGSSLKDADGKIVGVKYPAMEDRLRLYREGLELVVVFRDYIDLFSLAAYRRQVTEDTDILIDDLFFSLAEEAGLSPREWGMLAERMPSGTKIYHACTERSSIDQLLAAE